MVTIYYDTRTFKLRLPVLSVGRWRGQFLVHCASVQAGRRERHQARELHFARAVRRFDNDQLAVVAELQRRGV